MKKKGFIRVFLVTCMAWLTAISVCMAGPFTDPMPDDNFYPSASRDYTEKQVARTVVMEQTAIAPERPLSEYGVDPADIPEEYECDQIRFMRYRLSDKTLGGAPDDAGYADAGLLMVPGVVEGANGFQYIARHLVYQAYVNRDLRIEVWAMDRRANCLEDTTGSEKIEALYQDAIKDDKDGDGNPVDPSEEKAMLDTFAGYYYEGKPIDGKLFDGWYTSEDLPFLAEFGLRMDTEDMFRIIEEMVPDQAERKHKVFVGGHSLGGTHTSFFAGWDKDGNRWTRKDTGYNNTAGIFCFDSTLTPVDQIVDELVKSNFPKLADRLLDNAEKVTEPVYKAALSGLRSGKIPRIAEGEIAADLAGSPIGPESMALLESVGLLAYALPEKEHTATERVYENMGADAKATLQKHVSRNVFQNFRKDPDILDFRFTNEALLGLLFDDDFTHIPMIQTSMGFMYNGSVSEKGDRLSDDLPIFAATDSGYDFWRIHIDGPLYKWADFDQVARPGDPLTSMDGSVTYTDFETEMSSIRDLARAQFYGPTNLVEWYFPIRKIVDMIAAASSYGPEYGLNFMYSDRVAALPQITFTAGEGMFTDEIFGGDPNARIVPGANHMDPMFISANTSEFKKNPVIESLLDFVEDQAKPL
ncbi:MAG: hypothetical protein K9K62_00350 [Desulfobacteraceae bacterium]|nr:hypothetical protein [Desulfobacteraceae bacterium]